MSAEPRTYEWNELVGGPLAGELVAPLTQHPEVRYPAASSDGSGWITHRYIRRSVAAGNVRVRAWFHSELEQGERAEALFEALAAAAGGVRQ